MQTNNNHRSPRGVQNNNPLNIRYVKRNNWRGRRKVKADPNFEEFDTLLYGFRAAFILLNKYMNVYGCCTIDSIINRWAPESDNNNPELYASTVSGWIKFPSYQTFEFFDWPVVIPLMLAMAKYENGVSFNRDIAVEAYIMVVRYFGHEEVANCVLDAKYLAFKEI